MAPDRYGRLLEIMLTYHNAFRKSHSDILNAASSSQEYSSAELQTLLRKGLDLSDHIDLHHKFEEAHLFPILARRIPAFQSNAEHVQEHAEMHIALEAFEEYCQHVMWKLNSGSPEANSHDNERRMWAKDHYDSDRFISLAKRLGSTLFPHLDAEEKSIHPDNLRKAGFTESELRLFPF